MEDVLEIYKKPYNKNYPVIFMDESNKQHEQEKIKCIPAKSGQFKSLTQVMREMVLVMSF